MAKFLGIDTSCYTTSAAVYDSTEGIVGESRIILSVKAGKKEGYPSQKWYSSMSEISL